MRRHEGAGIEHRSVRHLGRRLTGAALSRLGGAGPPHEQMIGDFASEVRCAMPAYPRDHHVEYRGGPRAGDAVVAADEELRGCSYLGVVFREPQEVVPMDGGGVPI